MRRGDRSPRREGWRSASGWRDNDRVKASEVPTVKAKRSPIVLVVGFSASFVRRCNDAALTVSASVTGVEVGAESAFATQTIPIAIVMQSAAVRSSPLGSIARELGIELIALPDENVADAALHELITTAVTKARSRSPHGSR